MVHQSDIKEHMEVIGSDGQHVGTVDHLAKSGLIKLTKGDAKDGDLVVTERGKACRREGAGLSLSSRIKPHTSDVSTAD